MILINNTPAGAATHAVLRKTPFIRNARAVEKITYVAAGSAEECAALVQIFEDTRAVFGWDTENRGQIGAPSEEVTPIESVPARALPGVLNSSAAAMLQANAGGASHRRALRSAGLSFCPAPGEGALMILEA